MDDELPLPDLDADALAASSGVGIPELELSSDAETFTVTLLGFLRDRETAGEKLAQMFGLDEATAQSLVESSPAVVKRGASRATALAIEKGLRTIGADVDVRREPGSVRPGSFRPGPAGIAMASARPPPPSEPTSGAHPGFWSRIPVAFAVPFLRGGWVWLIGLTVMFFVVVFTVQAPCIGIFMLPVTGAAYLGLLGIYFGQAAQAGLEDDGSRPEPNWGAPNQQGTLLRGLALVLVTVLLFAIPFWLAFKGVSPAWIYLAGLLPYVYWPMALTVSGITGSVVSLFNPIDIGKGVIAGGIPYVVVVVVGFLAFAVMAALPLAALSYGPIAVVIAVLFPAFGICYVAGIQGYLMGCLVGSRREKFEGLV